MHAIVLDTPGPLESGVVHGAEVADPHPGPGQIVMKVVACGVCRSNLHMIEGDWVRYGVPAFTPIVPGHEVVGRVVEVGSQVDWLRPGDRVGVQPLWSTCGHCAYCLTGRDQLCASKQITGETVQGGYAEYMLATAAHAHPVPDSIDDVEAAPLFCPGITGYNAVSKAAPRPGSTLAVFGVGGVGHMVIQFAVLAGAEVYAVARAAEHRKLAEELGAHPVDATADDAVVLRFPGRRGRGGGVRAVRCRARPSHRGGETGRHHRPRHPRPGRRAPLRRREATGGLGDRVPSADARGPGPGRGGKGPSPL